MKLSEKYMPRELCDVVLPDYDTRDLIMNIAQGNPPDHLILHGPYGTGKSAVLHAMITEAEKNNSVDVTTLHGSMFETKSQVVSIFEMLHQRYRLVNWNGTRRMLIIDEVDMLTDFAQRQLCNIIDTALFRVQVLMTTNHLEGIDGRLRDRAEQIHMPYLPPEAWLDRAQVILKAEGVNETDAAVIRALKDEPGSIRGIMRVLEEICRQHSVRKPSIKIGSTSETVP